MKPILPGDQPPSANLAPAGEVPRRRFGNTDVVVSALGLGGSTFASAGSKKEALRIVQEAVDGGITFMDNAWDYHEGRSEKWMGEALKGRRQQVFLMSKVCTHGRDRNVAMRQLEDSLRRLKTDHLDLWQIHEVVYENDPDLHFAPGDLPRPGVDELLHLVRHRQLFRDEHRPDVPGRRGFADGFTERDGGRPGQVRNHEPVGAVPSGQRDATLTNGPRSAGSQ